MTPLLALAGAAIAVAGSAPPPLPRSVQDVIDRSHRSRASYSVATTAEIVWAHGRHVQTAYEFHQGAMLRIERPGEQIVANCDTGEGTIDSLLIIGRFGGGVDHVTIECGIGVNLDPPVSGRLLKPITGPYGRADVIELTGRKFVRRFAVTADGIIVGNDYVSRSAGSGFSLTTLKAVVRREPQDPAMFTSESLSRTFAHGAPGAAPEVPKNKQPAAGG